jgi:hypothetical protein
VFLKIIFADLSLEKIEAVRARMNVLRNPKGQDYM